MAGPKQRVGEGLWAAEGSASGAAGAAAMVPASADHLVPADEVELDATRFLTEQRARVSATREAGPAIHSSPRHRIPSNSIIKGTKRVGCRGKPLARHVVECRLT
jgi:hypothetical protein